MQFSPRSSRPTKSLVYFDGPLPQHSFGGRCDHTYHFSRITRFRSCLTTIPSLPITAHSLDGQHTLCHRGLRALGEVPVITARRPTGPNHATQALYHNLQQRVPRWRRSECSPGAALLHLNTPTPAHLPSGQLRNKPP
jgi:hypothetical protein